MKIHIVKKGDTLYELSKKYNIELDKLIAANPQIADPNVLDVGMKVKIPHEPKPVSPPTDYLYKHTVVQGDTLWKLGKAWGVPLGDMVAANPQLKNPNVLMTGDIVYIPKMKPQQHSNQHMPHHKKDTSQILPIEAAPINEIPPAPPAPPVVEAPIAEAPIAEAPIAEAPKPEAPIEKPVEKPIEKVVEKVAEKAAEKHEKANFEFPNIVSPLPIKEKEGKSNTPMYPMWEQPDFGMMNQPSVNPFQQFQMPAVEAMTHGKVKESDWHEPELPVFPTMTEAAHMPYHDPSANFPMYPTMTEAAHMPYHDPNANYAMFPTMEQPIASGDCGCGKPDFLQPTQLPAYQPAMPNQGFHPTAQMPAFYPGMPMPCDPFMHAQPFPFAAPSDTSPFGGAPTGVDPMATVSGYPGMPGYPNYSAAPMVSPYGMPFPWMGHVDCGCHGRSEGVEGSGEKVFVAQADESSAKKQPKRKSKESSARAALNSLIAKQSRKPRASTEIRKAYPWLNQY
ncbi:LysM peptidoglycan-binding domain-containing protein [Paenibacillus cremeus]|uniref:LysM peptidoglycan-binding domain-containing protein n=1 Tax=Paenibacillus cremeus TaxID=2163881 RepID=A0A559KIG7_9BACL|nr:LysM peptidoglycan-binding domain-containing protein [Paenibacillus cremeus]TVY11925.1 LysM peptidoglycan-binding domain-containing protein [Paenibacillus cremeus]